MQEYEGISRRVIYQKDEDFPLSLKEHISDISKLYLIGEHPIVQPLVAIIGARDASPYGLKAASLVAKWAVNAGCAVISGCARGCDQQAHSQALAEGGLTYAVLGCGADVIYPSGARSLLRSIARNGAIISRYEWGEHPARYRFVERNRIIAALSDLVVVCEAKVPSGTFSTVGFANDFGVNVAAVPGSIFSALSRGPNRLIMDGAYSLSLEDDFLSALGFVLEGRSHKEESIERDPILRALRSEAHHADDLSRLFNKPVTEILNELQRHEIEGLVSRYPDGRFAILKK